MNITKGKALLLAAVVLIALVSAVAITYIYTRNPQVVALDDAEEAVLATEKAAVSARKAADSTANTAESAKQSANDAATAAKDASTVKK